MADVVHVIVHVLNAAEREEVTTFLEPFGETDNTNGCVFGHIDPSRIEELQDRGFLVEQPLDDPDQPDKAPIDELLSDDGDSVLSQLRSASPKVFLAKTIGPLRPKWLDSLNRSGARIQSVRNPAHFSLSVDETGLDELKSKSWVKSIREVGPADATVGVGLPKKAGQQPSIEYEMRFRAPTSTSAADMAIEGSLDPTFEALVSELSADTRFEDVAVGSRRQLFFKTKHDGLVEDLRKRPGVLGISTERTYELSFGTENQNNIRTIAAALEKDTRVKDIQVGTYRIRFRCDTRSPLLVSLAGMADSLTLYREPELGNTWARQGIGLDVLPTSAAAEMSKPETIPWTGKGVVVGVADGGIDSNHVDLKDAVQKVLHRVPQMTQGDPNGHGTHVCGTIVGNGAGSNGAIRGMAPDARLVVQCMMDENGTLAGKPLDLADLYEEARLQGVHIHSNSWGSKTEGLSSSDSFETDRYAYEHPDFFILFAAGNDGVWTESAAKRCTLRSPGTAKNVLTVGACCSGRAESPYSTSKQVLRLGNSEIVEEPLSGDPSCIPTCSSRGPADDGRVKPDLVAPGTAILSTWPGYLTASRPAKEPSYTAAYAWSSGTSMATPVVAGAAACVRQYFVEGRKIQPSAALMRAALIQATTWLDRPSIRDEAVGKPNFNQGHGRLDLGVLFGRDNAGEQARILVRDIARTDPEALYQNTALSAVGGHPQLWSSILRVNANAKRPLRITLAWTDRPGRGLQQDLDLIVRVPGRKKPAGGNPDHVRMPWQPLDRTNNVENIVIADPAAGEYTVIVKAFTTPIEPQGYALLVSGDLDQDDWLVE